MKQLLDFLPLLLFFIFYKLHDIYWASGALIVATAFVILLHWLVWRRVEKMALVTFLLVAFFGGLTIALRNDQFIKWKVSLVYWLSALSFLVSAVWSKKPLLQHMLGKELTLPALVWKQLTVAWILFFILCGVANLYVAFHFTQATWVNFKFFGLTGAMLLFILGCGIYIRRYLPLNKQ